MAFLTFFDVVDHVLDQVVGGDGSVRNARQARRAVAEAVEELCERRDWRYYFRPDLIQTQDSYSTGTVAYTASTRTMTLSGGTWPTDAEDQAVIIAGARFGVDTRVSGSVILLRDGDCPTQDIAAGTSYTMAKDSYLLPETVRKIDYLYDTLAPGRMLPMTSPDSIMRERRLCRQPSYPVMYSVFRHEKYHGRMAIHFAPSCSTSRSYAFMAMHRAPMPTFYEVIGGTVGTTSGSSTLTGTSTAFTSAMESCVIRISNNDNLPTGPYGYRDDSLNPPAYEGILKGYSSATSYGLEAAADQSLTGKNYRISSLIDIAPTMRNALLRLAEAKFSPQDRKGYPDRLAEYERAFGVAAYADQTMQESPGVGFVPHTLADIASSVAVTN